MIFNIFTANFLKITVSRELIEKLSNLDNISIIIEKILNLSFFSIRIPVKGF